MDVVGELVPRCLLELPWTLTSFSPCATFSGHVQELPCTQFNRVILRSLRQQVEYDMYDNNKLGIQCPFPKSRQGSYTWRVNSTNRYIVRGIRRYLQKAEVDG